MDKTGQKRSKIRYGMTRSQLADALLIDKDVFRRFLRDIGIKHSYKLTPREIEIIRIEFGVEYMDK